MTTDTPRAPDPPLVDPETGETAPLSPQTVKLFTPMQRTAYEAMLRSQTGQVRRAFLYGEWDDYETDLAAHLEPDDAA